MKQKKRDNLELLSKFGIVNIKEKRNKQLKKIKNQKSNCYSCKSKLSNSNYCILCTNIFCNSCLNEKKLCQNCQWILKDFNQIIEKNMMEITERDEKYMLKESYYCNNFNDFQSSCKNFVTKEDFNYFEEFLLDNGNKTFELIIKTLINYVLKINFNDTKVVEKWNDIIFNLIKETITNMHPSARYLDDSLNINDYIKIKLIQYKDTSECKVIQGYVMQHNKKGKNVRYEIENPKIIMINKEIINAKEERNLNSTQLDNLNDNYYNLIENKLNILKPDIVIVGKNFPKEKIEMIINNNNLKNISFIYDIKDNVIKKLSRCIQAFVLPSFKLIGENNYFGSCKHFNIKKFSDYNSPTKSEETNNKKINTNFKKEEQNKNLYIFSGCNKLLFSTIILSGNDINELKKLKKILRQILLPSIYDLFLQIYLRYTLNIGIEEIPKQIENGMKQIETLLEESNELVPLKDDNQSSNNNKENSENQYNKEKSENHSNTINKENSLNKENNENKETKGNNEYRENQENNEINENNKNNGNNENKENNENNGNMETKENKENKETKRNKEMQKELTKKHSNSKDNNIFYQGFDLSTIEQKDDFKIYFLTFLKSSQKHKPKNINEESTQKITEKEIHKMVNKYCEEATEKNHSFFNKKYDKSLGKFIIDLCKNACAVCEKCKLEYNKHTLYYFSSSGVLKIWMISLDENDLETVIYYLNSKTDINYLSNKQINKDEKFSYSQINSDIYTYGYCKICKRIVTPLFKINNEVFNYSAYKFMKIMLENHSSKNQQRQFEYNINSNNKIICNHYINKDISRIFVTKFGSWIFEYNDIKKHYISPMDLNISDSPFKTFIFNNYQRDGYSNSTNSLNLIQKTLLLLKEFFNQILENEKLYLFKDHINSIKDMIESIHRFNETFMNDLINKYLKLNLDKYNNNYVRLIAHIKKIYFKIVKIKLIIDNIYRLKTNLEVISDIFNSKPLEDENNKINESKEFKNESLNEINSSLSDINFGKDSSFNNILTFINYSANKHDLFSCEFIQEDLTSFIANILSSNDYIKLMKSKEGLNLSFIKRRKTNNKMINDIIKQNLSQKEKYSSIKQILSFEGHNNSKDIFDTLLIFDQSKEEYYVEEEKNYSSEKIKGILEEELKNKEIEHKTCYLNNDLYSIFYPNKKRKKNNSIAKSQNGNTPSNNIKEGDYNNINSNNMNEDEDKKKGKISENTKYNQKISKINNQVKNDYKKITLYFKDIDVQILKLLAEFEEIKKAIIKNLSKVKDEKKALSKKDQDKYENNMKNIIKEISESTSNEKNENKQVKANINNEDNDENNESKDSSKDNNKSEDIKNSNSSNSIGSNEQNNNNEIYENKTPDKNKSLLSSLKELKEKVREKRPLFFEEKLILKLSEMNDIEITIYYPKQFEALRTAYCASLEDLLISLSKSAEWSENSGGKSKASFFKTFDEKFILKNIKENEFNMFLDNALKYFDYMSQFLFHKKASILAKILGAYKILVKDNNEDIKYHLILMENINYGIISKNTIFNSPDSNIRVYDLKGSNLRRYIDETKIKPGKVLLDSNFILDFDREPVLIELNVYERLKHALINDSTYLKSLNVIDYSLLIIFKDIKKKKEYKTNDLIDTPKDENNYSLIKLGIIDYTRKYTFDKQVESVVKSVRYGQKPTIVNPTEYSERFYNTISKYFVGV